MSEEAIRLIPGTVLFCEKAECRVIIFRNTDPARDANGQNCPGCGEFGRTKD